MPIGLKVLYYESSPSDIRGPYPAFISSYNPVLKTADLRVFMEDAFALFNMNNIPIYNPAQNQMRFWSQTDLFPHSRFEKIGKFLEVQTIDLNAPRILDNEIDNPCGAFLKILNADGITEKEIYIQPHSTVIVRQT